MAKIGFLYPKYSKVTVSEDQSGNETETYGAAKVLSKAIAMTTSINAARADLYADDGLAETVSEFVDGTFSFEGDDLEDEVEADITGADITQDGTITNKDDDTAPYLRLGALVRRYKKNKSQYRGVILTRVKFDQIPDSYQTKGESITFGTAQLTGRIMRNCRREWRIKSAWFDTLEDAQDWMDDNLVP